MRTKVNKWNILFMLLGNLVLGLGVAVFKLSGLGNDPYTGMVMALGERVHMEYANLLVILNIVLFIVQITLGRKYIGFGTFFNAILQGYVVTFFYYLVCKLGAPEVLWQKLVTVVIGLLVGGIVNVGTVASVLLMGPVADIINRKFVSRIIKDDAEAHGRYRPNYWTV